MAEQHPVTWLADVLRAAGVTVVEHDGWKTRGRPLSTGSFLPRGVMLHEDGSGRGSSPNEPSYLVRGDGEGSAKPGPLCQLWIDYQGRWHTIAAGRCNHAGVGPGFGVVPRNSGNTYLIGIETDNTEGEDWTPAMRRSLVPGMAALFRRLGADPAHALMGHKEYAPGRKSDPDSINMPQLRRDVAAALTPAPPKPPAPKDEWDMTPKERQALIDDIAEKVVADLLVADPGKVGGPNLGQLVQTQISDDAARKAAAAVKPQLDSIEAAVKALKPGN